MPAPALHNPRYRREENRREALDGRRVLGYLVNTMNTATHPLLTTYQLARASYLSAVREAVARVRVGADTHTVSHGLALHRLSAELVQAETELVSWARPRVSPHLARLAPDRLLPHALRIAA